MARIMAITMAAAAALLGLGAASGGMAQDLDVSSVPVGDAQSALPKDWNQTASFMEIFVRSYQDSNGDGIGDFKGLTSRLDYLKSLGVTGIWLMPIMPSGDHDHGYAVSDYRAIDPDYGTMADFETFVREAHKRGIGVILDFVINHSASDNAIFRSAEASKDSPYRDWYVFSDQNPGWYDAKTRGQDGAFYTDPWRKVKDGPGWYYGVFSEQMPDWNLRNPRVVQYLQDTMRFWMNKGVDGFRLDAVTMLLEDGPKSYFNNPGNPAIVAKLRQTLDEYQNRYMICEASEGADAYLSACDAFAYGTQQHIIASVKSGRLDAELIRALNDPKRDLKPLALQSHDSYVGDRLIDQFGVNGVDGYELAAAISILASATPFSYYGEEIGMSNNGVYNDPGLRAPMSWTGETKTVGFTTGRPYRDVAINAASMNVANEQNDPYSLLNFYSQLYALRRAHPVFGTGVFDLQSAEGDPVLIFTRTAPDDQAVVAVNLSQTAQALTVKVTPNSGFTLGGKLIGRSDALGRLKVTVAPRDATVLFRQPGS
jgi:maltose alpha-D-glucosyltransferase/alpha-amylase